MNKLQERMFEINTRKAEIRKDIETNKEKVDINKYETELRNLNAELDDLQKRMKLADGITIEKPKDDDKMENNYTVDSKEYRSAFLKKLQGNTLNEVEKRAFTSVADSAGAAIPTQTADEIVTKLKQVAPLLNEITLLQVAGDVKFAVEDVRDNAARHTENATVNPAGDKLVSVSLGGYEYVKVISISKTVQTMAVDAFEGWLTQILSEDIARAIENDIINGTGTDQPKGVAYANTWDDTNSLTVASGSSLTYANVCNFVGLLPGGYNTNAKFLMSKKTLFTDFMPLMDKSKTDLVYRNLDGSFVILGYPVLLSDSVALHDAYLGDYTKIVGNLSQNITVESSVESGFRSNSIDFRGAAIFDSKPAIGEAFVKLTKAEA
jgi:HK97 family phage major capsid protein